jgi:hypothetical protein
MAISYRSLVVALARLADLCGMRLPCNEAVRRWRHAACAVACSTPRLCRFASSNSFVVQNMTDIFWCKQCGRLLCEKHRCGSSRPSSLSYHTSLELRSRRVENSHACERRAAEIARVRTLNTTLARLSMSVDGATLQMTSVTSEEMEQLRIDMVRRAEEELRRTELEKVRCPTISSRLHPATSAPGLPAPLPHLHRDRALPCHICTRTGLRVPLTCPFRGAAGSKTPARQGARGTIFPNEREKEGTQPEPWMCAISISRDVCTPHPISCVCWRLYACAVG